MRRIRLFILPPLVVDHPRLAVAILSHSDPDVGVVMNARQSLLLLPASRNVISAPALDSSACPAPMPVVPQRTIDVFRPRCYARATRLFPPAVLAGFTKDSDHNAVIPASANGACCGHSGPGLTSDATGFAGSFLLYLSGCVHTSASASTSVPTSAAALLPARLRPRLRLRLLAHSVCDVVVGPAPRRDVAVQL